MVHCDYKKSLTERVLDYQRTGEGYQAIHDELCLKVYRYPKKKYGLSDEDCGNFYLSFVPKLKQCAQTYKKTSGTFETYLGSVLLWRLKSYIKKQKLGRCMWRISKDEYLWQPARRNYSLYDLYKLITENPALASVFQIEKNGKIKNESGRRQFLVLILKRVKDLDLDDIHFLSIVTGYDYRWIIEIVEDLKESLSRQFRRMAYFRARRNRAFWRMNLLERQLKYVSNKRLKARLKRKTDRAKETMKTAMEVMSRIRLSPTHRQIARSVNISSGTIDSLFLRLGKKLKRVYKQKEKQYA